MHFFYRLLSALTLPDFFTFMSGKAWLSRTTSIAGQSFVCIVSRRVSWKLTEAAMWNTRGMWIDMRIPRCSAENPSPALDISPSTYVTFMSLSFGTEANSCKELNCFELSHRQSKAQNLNTSTLNKTSTYKYYSMSCTLILDIFRPSRPALDPTKPTVKYEPRLSRV